MREIRVAVVGFGTVGRWLLRAVEESRSRLAERYGVAVRVVALANRRDGLVYSADGLDLAAALAGDGGPLGARPGARHWSSALEGLPDVEADVLVEVSASPAADGEPGLAHMRAALERGMAVVTSNKWPVALRGVELSERARSRGVQFRAESTVMSGTPLLSALVDGLAGAVPLGLRGVVNATANFILSAMADGRSYEEALAGAQRAGLAERDPSADVDGPDSVAKLMILSALVFGRQLAPGEVSCRGIAEVTRAQVDDAAANGARIRHLATLDFGAGQASASVEPVALPLDDPLARVDRTANAVVCRAEPVGEVTVIGPGAGPELAGQGVFSDLISVARSGWITETGERFHAGGRARRRRRAERG